MRLSRTNKTCSFWAVGETLLGFFSRPHKLFCLDKSCNSPHFSQSTRAINESVDEWIISWSPTDRRHHLYRKVAHSFHTAVVKIFTTEVWPRKYKQQKRTPLLFLTGKSPQVIFPLPWNKSMKQSSLWTIAHLLKSDAGRGGSHHRADSVCWQRMPLI